MEATVRARGPGRAAGEVLWATADAPHARTRGPHPGENATSAARRQHALEHPQTRQGDGGQSWADCAGVAPSGAATASTRALHAVRRPGLRAEGGGRVGAVLESAGARRRVRRG